VLKYSRLAQPSGSFTSAASASLAYDYEMVGSGGSGEAGV